MQAPPAGPKKPGAYVQLVTELLPVGEPKLRGKGKQFSENKSDCPEYGEKKSGSQRGKQVEMFVEPVKPEYVPEIPSQ